MSLAFAQIYEKISLANGMFNNYVPFVKPVFQNRIEKTEVALAVLDKYLASNTFLVGDRITLADISVGATLADAFSKFLGPVEQKKYANVVRFEQTIVNHPKLAAAFAGVSLATEVATYTPPKKDAPAKAPKAEAAPKAPKAKAAKKEDDEEEEESHADAPAPKNPLELLPKPALNLIDVKVKYSNTDTKVRFLRSLLSLWEGRLLTALLFFCRRPSSSPGSSSRTLPATLPTRSTSSTTTSSPSPSWCVSLYCSN